MKKLLKFLGYGFLILFVLALIGTIMGDDTESTTEEEKTEDVATSESSSTSEEKPEEEESSTVGIGEVLRVGDVEFTINSYETAYKISDRSGFYTEEPSADGAVFLIVDATVKNVGKEVINTDSSFFSVLTNDGLTYKASTSLIDGFFLFESINPGLGQSGKVAFEIPEGLSDLSIQVQTGFWGTQTGIIKLQ